MEAEVMIGLGLLLIALGTLGLVLRTKSEKDKPASITENYRKYYQGHKYHNIYKILGLISFGGGAFFWIISDRIWLWTILCVLTIGWFWRVKKTTVITTLMWLIAMMLAYFNLNAGLIWLLAVVAAGYFETPKISEIRFEDLPKLTAIGSKNEGLIICPACQEMMKLYSTQDGEEKIMFDKCPKCQAIFFDDESHLWAIRKTQIINNKLQINDKGLKCPRCQITMKKNPEYLQCSRCLGLLLV